MKPITRRDSEHGQTMFVVLMLGLILAIFGYALTKIFVVEAFRQASTDKRDRLFTVGDAALQRAQGAILQNVTASGAISNWTNADTLPGFASLTVTGYTDVSGTTYYVAVRKGTLQDVSNVGAANDTSISAWANVGDLNDDRTIFVRTVDWRTNQEDRFYATVHRTDKPPYVYGGDAMAASGSITLGNNWSGHVFNSCLGPYNGSGSQPNSSGSLNIGGSITSGWPNANWTGYNATQGSTTTFPTLVKPATIAVPGFTTASSISSAITLANATANTTVNYECAALDLHGAGGTITVNGPGRVALWISGGGDPCLTMGGSTSVTINNYPGCPTCLSNMLTIYIYRTVADPNPDNGTRSVSWNGTPQGNFLLVGPTANMEYKGGGSNTFQGAIVVQNLSVAPNSNAAFYYDSCLATKAPANNYSAPPLIVTGWRQIGYKNQKY